MRKIVTGIALIAFGSLLGFSMSFSVPDIQRYVSLDVEMTAYSPSKSQTQGDPFQMASGRFADPEDLEQLRFVALSRDILAEYDIQWGDTVWIGFRVEDKMGPWVKGGVDLFMRNISLAKKFGRQKRTIIIQK